MCGALSRARSSRTAGLLCCPRVGYQCACNVDAHSYTGGARGRSGAGWVRLAWSMGATDITLMSFSDRPGICLLMAAHLSVMKANAGGGIMLG